MSLAAISPGANFGRRVKATAIGAAPSLAAGVTALLLSGCGGSRDVATHSSTTAPTTNKPALPGAGQSFNNSTWAIVVANANAYKGANVTLVGKVFQVGATTNGYGQVVQMWADAADDNQNTIVVTDGSTPVQDEEVIRVRGTVRREVSGTNGFGATVSAPVVDATSISNAGPMALASTPICTLKATPYVVRPDPQGFPKSKIVINPYKIEFAPDETRVFLRIINHYGDSITFDASDAHLIVNGSQYDSTYSQNSYPSVSDSILDDVQSQGVIVYPPAPGCGAGKVAFTTSVADGRYGTPVFGPYTWTWGG